MEDLNIVDYNRKRVALYIAYIYAFRKWRIDRDSSLSRIFRNAIKKFGSLEKGVDVRGVFESATYEIQVMMAIQEFTQSYEFLKNKSLNTAMPLDNNRYKNIKGKIDVDGVEKSTNPQQILDVIRQAFAHNDDSVEVPNWYVDDKLNVHIRSKIKKTNQMRNLEIDLNQLRELIYIFLNNNNLDKANFPSFEVKSEQLENAVKKGILNEKNVQNYFILKNTSTGENFKLSKYQKKILAKKLTTQLIFKEPRTKFLDAFSEDFLFRIFPNESLNFSDIINVGDIGQLMNYVRTNYMSFEKFYKTAITSRLEILKDLDEEAKRNDWTISNYLINEDRVFENALIINMLFSIFSTISPRNLEEIWQNPNVDINRLRNSVIHGRYYYDCEGSFLFFDGIKEMTLIAKLSIEEILNFANNIFNDYANEIKRTSGC